MFSSHSSSGMCSSLVIKVIDTSVYAGVSKALESTLTCQHLIQIIDSFLGLTLSPNTEHIVKGCENLKYPIYVETYQNSPSSMWLFISSLSAGSIPSHSEELEIKYKRYTMSKSCMRKSIRIHSDWLTHLSLQAPVHSTCPQGFRMRISLSLLPRKFT